MIALVRSSFTRGATRFSLFSVFFVVLLDRTHLKRLVLTRVPLLSQLLFPINKMVWNMHNNTNSTDIRQFWEKLGWRPLCKFLPLTDCSLQKTATGNGNLQPEIEINEYSPQP